MTQVIEGGVTTTYTYDNIDQLTGECRSGYTATYTYDANGNRLTKTLNSVTENYSYDSADKLLSAGSKTYDYDDAGRTTEVTVGGVTTYLTYDYEGRVTSITKSGVTTNSFAYNGLDTRVSKTDSAGTKTFRRSGAYVTDPVLGDGSANFTPGISERRSSTTTYLHSALKNADVQTGNLASVTGSRRYDSFGNVMSSSGTWQGPFGNAGGFGYQEDSDHGLKLLGHRYYDSSTGRFLTRDPAKDGRNWYVYCRNNPIKHFDAQGLFRLIIIGDLDGVLGGDWGGYATLPRPGKSDVLIDEPRTKEEIIELLIECEEFHFYGHGNESGTLYFKGGVKLTINDLHWIAIQRIIRGKKKMRKASVRACYSVSKKELVNIWLEIADIIEGYCGLSGQLWPPKLNPRETFRRPVSRDPGDPIGKKK